MTLVKQGIDVSFARGLDTKTDPKRVQIGNFLSLENSVFQKGGLLQKRNGYGQLQSLPNTSSTYLQTFNGNLTAIGSSIYAYNKGDNNWVQKGNIQPLSLNTLPLLRNNFNQSSIDAAVAPNGLVCTVYDETNASSTTKKFVIADSVTGQNITAPAVITPTTGTVTGHVRVFLLGNFFIIMFNNNISGTINLDYIAISIYNPSVVGANQLIATQNETSGTVNWDAYVTSNKLYIAYDRNPSQAVAVTYLTTSFVLASPTAFATQFAVSMSVTADNTNPAAPIIYLSYTSGIFGVFTAAVDQNLNVVLAPTRLISVQNYTNITSAALNGSVYIALEQPNDYTFDGALPTNYIDAISCTQGGTIGTLFTSIRSVGLASKAFIIDGTIYYMAAFQSAYQNTYFVINASLSTEASPAVVAKLAYQNGGGYLLTGLPGVTVINNLAQMPYLFKDLIQAVNKNTNVSVGTQVAGIYSQTGINLASFTFGTQNLDTAEIGNDLHLSGGFLWMYDGYLPVEHNFLVYPDTDVANPTDMAVWSNTGGSMRAQPDAATNANAYYYQFTYEWTDNNGNAFRSAPSVPVPVTTTGSGLTGGSVVLNIPTLRLTYKIANPVKICIYRWSVAQQNYYEVTSITSPLLNDTTVDSVTYTDTLADPSILGNALIYTTGGVVEDVNAPASNLMTLFDTRLWLVDAEDQNLLWFSKQVIEATPVEMSDLFTFYIAPTTASQGSTGPISAIAPMDDKLIIFKQNAIYYINGTGPDNTGANNQYSQPIFITSTVGCSNQQSIVFMPQGLMFQSSKGIWLLDRGLNTSYIGAPVEKYNAGVVESAQNIPGTNQVRFILDSGVTLMFDYFYSQWGTFTGVPAISSCIYENLHTFINSSGQVYQESPGTYLDGSNPVLMQFTTGPIRLGDLQNYQRAYTFFLLGSYISPHKLYIGVSYDYEGVVTQTDLLVPNNYSTPYGSGSSQSPYGEGSPYGGPGTLEHYRVFLQRQRCMAVSLSVQEFYDPTLGAMAGAGLTLSGINFVCGFKGKWSTISATKSYG